MSTPLPLQLPTSGLLPYVTALEGSLLGLNGPHAACEAAWAAWRKEDTGSWEAWIQSLVPTAPSGPWYSHMWGAYIDPWTGAYQDGLLEAYGAALEHYKGVQRDGAPYWVLSPGGPVALLREVMGRTLPAVGFYGQSFGRLPYSAPVKAALWEYFLLQQGYFRLPIKEWPMIAGPATEAAWGDFVDRLKIPGELQKMAAGSPLFAALRQEDPNAPPEGGWELVAYVATHGYPLELDPDIESGVYGEVTNALLRPFYVEADEVWSGFCKQFSKGVKDRPTVREMWPLFCQNHLIHHLPTKSPYSDVWSTGLPSYLRGEGAIAREQRLSIWGTFLGQQGLLANPWTAPAALDQAWRAFVGTILPEELQKAAAYQQEVVRIVPSMAPAQQQALWLGFVQQQLPPLDMPATLHAWRAFLQPALTGPLQV